MGKKREELGGLVPRFAKNLSRKRFTKYWHPAVTMNILDPGVLLLQIGNQRLGELPGFGGRKIRFRERMRRVFNRAGWFGELKK